MNFKTKYTIPVFAAVFALMFAVATPYVMAESGDHANWEGKTHHMGPRGPMGPHAILVEDFTGSIQIPEEMNPDTHDSIKSQITVTLSQAVSLAEEQGFEDAMRASIGIVKDSDGNKYLVWTVFSMDRDQESGTITKNIFVVDAGDITNFTTVSKTFDPAEMKGQMHDDKTGKFEKQHYFSPTGNADVDGARAQFHDLMQQLREAYKNGDTDTAQSIKDQLQELKQTFLNVRNSQF